MNPVKCLAISMMGTAAGLMLYCGSFYIKSYRENQQELDKYKRIENECMENENNENGEPDFSPELSPKPEKKKIRESFGISWEKLEKTNPQIIGWVTVPGADISYPIVQGKDDEFYLSHSVTEEKSPFGSIFLGCDHKKSFLDSHSLVYGHNMEGNMMFANLNRYESSEFLKKCPEFYITTPGRKFCYEIFSVEQAAEDGVCFRYGYKLGSKNYEEQQNIFKENSMYDTGVLPDSAQRMVTLVTCNSRLDENIRMTIHGICRNILKQNDSED